MKSINYSGDGKYVMMEKGDTQFYKHRKGGEKRALKLQNMFENMCVRAQFLTYIKKTQ